MDDARCAVCFEPLGATKAEVACAGCGLRCHVRCLAEWFRRRPNYEERCLQCAKPWQEAFPHFLTLIDQPSAVLRLRPRPRPRPAPRPADDASCLPSVARVAFLAQMTYLLTWGHAAIVHGTCQHWNNPFVMGTEAVCYLSRNYSATAGSLLLVLAYLNGMVGVWMGMDWPTVVGYPFRRLFVGAAVLVNLALLTATGGPRYAELCTWSSACISGLTFFGWDTLRFRVH